MGIILWGGGGTKHLARKGKQIGGIARKGNVIYRHNNTHIYGIKRTLNSSSPTWERTDAAIGKIANATHDGSPVQNDFDNLYPWSDIISYNYDTETQEIKAYYGEEGFKFDGSNGDVLTKIPEFWYKRWQDASYEYIQIADKETEGFLKSNEFSLGRYPISGNSVKISSISGVKPLVSTVLPVFRNYAKKLGEGFGIMDWRFFLIQILYLVEYASYDSKNTLGVGNELGPSGRCDILGMKSGSLSASVIYRGIEGIMSNIAQFIDGLNIKDYQTYVCYDPTKYDCNVFDGSYQKIGYINDDVSHYIKTLGYDKDNPLISMPTEAWATSSTYICGRYVCRKSENVVLVGRGNLFDILCDSHCNATVSFGGARLLKYD